jgi:hypothetical protein
VSLVSPLSLPGRLEVPAVAARQLSAVARPRFMSTAPAAVPRRALLDPRADRCVVSARSGYEIMERILKPLVGVFDDVMQELHDSRVPDVGREEEDAFMSKAVQYIRQYILSDRVTMR